MSTFNNFGRDYNNFSAWSDGSTFTRTSTYATGGSGDPLFHSFVVRCIGLAGFQQWMHSKGLTYQGAYKLIKKHFEVRWHQRLKSYSEAQVEAWTYKEARFEIPDRDFEMKFIRNMTTKTDVLQCKCGCIILKKFDEGITHQCAGLHALYVSSKFDVVEVDIRDQLRSTISINPLHFNVGMT